jgi:hypothetical protein
MKKRVFIFLGLFVFWAVGFGQSVTGHPLHYFLPKDYVILDSAQGDINNDGIDDFVVALKSVYENTDTETARPLLLLIGTKTGGYTLFASNDSVVLCKNCGGVFGDPYEGITIKKGFFEINHRGGSRFRWTRNISFRFKPGRNEFILYRDAGISYDDANPDKNIRQVTHKEDFNRVAFVKYTYDKD